MKSRFLVLFLFFLIIPTVYGQSQFSIVGAINKSDYLCENSAITILLNPLGKQETADTTGRFKLNHIPAGTYTLEAYCQSAFLFRTNIEVTDHDVNLGVLSSESVESNDNPIPAVVLSYQEIETEDANVESISPLLQSSQDPFNRAVSFGWGDYFFTPRGLDTRYSKVLIDGIEMNTASTGTPVWRNWSGLNSIFQYPEFASGIGMLSNHHGGLTGASNYTLMAGNIRKQNNFSLSFSNRNSYQHRVSGTYASGMNTKGWAYVFSGSARLGGEPIFKSGREGAFFNGYSFFASVQKKWNEQHSLNLAIVGAYTQRGTNTAPITKEIRNLFGIQYNPYWGIQEGKIRNDRIREDFQPIFQLTHEWKLSERSRWSTTASVQIGKNGVSRLQQYDQPNMSPIYYRYLPSYAVDNGNDPSTATVYSSGESFPIDGRQINWNYIYQTNRYLSAQGLSAGYALNNQAQMNTNYALSTSFSHTFLSKVRFDATLAYQYNEQNTYSEILDLLGANYLNDLDLFNNTSKNKLASNVVRKVGDKIDYDALLYRHYAYANTVFQVDIDRFSISLSGRLSSTHLQREGLFWNGFYAQTSYGKSSVLQFWNPSLKWNVVYKITGHHFVQWNAVYGSEPPSWSDAFPNSRYENTSPAHIASVEIVGSDIGYTYRSPNINGRATLYYIQKKNEIDVSYYFTQGASYDAFVAEVLSGIETQHVGIELATEAKITTALKLNFAASIGKHTYANNPTVTTMGDVVKTSSNGENLTTQVIGESYLKNLRLANGPQEAYRIGLQYLSATYWRLGIGGNYVGSAFVRPSAIKRTYLFANDPVTGIDYAGYTPALARQLLQQEELPGGFYMDVNVSKSWRVKTYTVGFQLSINNLTNNVDIVTNGYEQSRYASFPDLMTEANRSTPLFGNRYFYGQGINFFLNLFLRF